MPLKTLWMNHTQVVDLSPLKNTSIQNLSCENTPVSDLSPLAEIPLIVLNIKETQVTDLSPLRQIPLESLTLDLPSLELNRETVENITTLKRINGKPANEVLSSLPEN